MDNMPKGPNVAMASTFRTDAWANRAAAGDAFRKNPMFRSFDPKVLELYLQHGLRELPTTIYPDLPRDSSGDGSKPVTLTTTKHQEVWTFARSNFTPQTSANDGHISNEERLLNPNADPGFDLPLLFNRSECLVTHRNLPHVRPFVYYVYGGKSPFSPPQARMKKESCTGTGIGGNGGAKAGNVKTYVVENGDHFLPFTNPNGLAETMAAFVAEGLRRFQKDETMLENLDRQKSERDRLVVSKTWREGVKKPGNARRPIANKL
ncbi:MAG: hypothetical protein Q9223_004023 [Gallowayella weberi]